MSLNNHNDEAPDTIQVNQFLDPPIRRHDRNDESEVPEEVIEDKEMRNAPQEIMQNEGYRSDCRE